MRLGGKCGPVAGFASATNRIVLVADRLSVKERSRLMSRIRSKDTGPELAVRRFLHAAGYRYSLHPIGIPGKPDLFLRRYNAAIFVHGCFWHRHLGCADSTLPGGSASKRTQWRNKLDGNRRRDKRLISEILRAGLRVAVVWECTTRHPKRHPVALQELARWLEGKRRYVELPQKPRASGLRSAR
jgi:DNA mismatch endonuclease (patch repair protein)